jgi:ATP-dependent DNA helicase RecQ
VTESQSVLKKYWGYESFRPPQDLIIDAVLKKSDTIALLPTGGGKSVCYQVPSLIFSGKTIVISPLIALMQDQVDNLFTRGIIAKSLNANLHYKEIDAILDNFVFGDLKMLYISPERIGSEVFMTRIQKANISLIAVDEAHCISQWGYDFRPSYFNIPRLREIHPKVPILALTATATPLVLKDISERLELKNPAVFQKSFSRDNLGLTVINGDDKKNELLRLLSRVKGCCIIYVRNRRETVEISQWLGAHGISCVSYHGGMDKDTREKNQAAWMHNHVRMIVCTNAFGMGIDKPDVRLVIHLDLAPSIEEYYQEAGRAGRDGNEAHAVTLVDESDIDNAIQNFNEQFPSLEIIGGTYDRLCRFYKVAYGSGMMESYDFSILDFADYTSIPVKKVFHIISILEKEGWITTSEAFKEPSKLMVMASTEDLDYLEKNAGLKSRITVHLLRKYEGLFVDFVKIDENRVAQELGIEVSKLIQTLQILKNENLVQYIPRATVPQLTFTQSRPQPESFSIDKKSYLNRKKMAEERLQAMIKYIRNENICRQKVIVDYFGEDGKNCGKCDICLGANAMSLTYDETQKVLNHLIRTINTAPFPLKKYVNLYPFNKRKRILKAIQSFESENLIHITDAGIIYAINHE